MPNPIVSIVQPGINPAHADLYTAVVQAVELAAELGISYGDRVLVKPNLVASPPTPESGACTSAAVCRALCDVISDAGGTPFIAESSARGIDTEEVMRFMGFAALRDLGYEVMDLKREEKVRAPVPGGEVLDQVTTWRPVLEADAIVSVPVLKTHDQTDTSLSMKNLKGLVTDPEKRRIHQLGVFEGVSDLVSLFQPRFALIDGIIGQEGLGPVYGLPVEMGLLIAGRQCLATDVVGARVIGFEDDEVRLHTMAARRGLGTADLDEIEVRGTPIARVARRFMRMEEDDRIATEGITIVHAEGTCTGCRNGVLTSLYDMILAGTIAEARGTVLVTGEAEIPSDVDPERVVPIGICCSEALRAHPRWVRGCPPNNVDIINAILATTR